VWRTGGQLLAVANYHPLTGVRAFTTGAGAVLFANVNPYIATVLPTRVLTAIWTHYPIDDHFSKKMRASQFKIGWCSIWSLTLAEKCLPPADERIEIWGQTLDVHYKYIPTIRDITKPQIGLINEVHPTWLHASCTLSDNAKSKLAETEKVEIGFGQAEARNCIFNHIEDKQGVEDYDWNNAVRDDIKPELFLSLK
jgi:hypothetical protein